jgi:hypothetical protein
MERLEFDFEAGIIYRKLNGKIVRAGWKTKKGYRHIEINGKFYSEHRLLFEQYHNCCLLPKTQIDHIDKNKSNNSINNLRMTTNSENQQNRSVNKNNLSTGHKNIQLRKNNTYRAIIALNGKKVLNKTYKTLQKAIEARDNKYIELNKQGCIFSI